MRKPRLIDAPRFHPKLAWLVSALIPHIRGSFLLAVLWNSAASAAHRAEVGQHSPGRLSTFCPSQVLWGGVSLLHTPTDWPLLHSCQETGKCDIVSENITWQQWSEMGWQHDMNLYPDLDVSFRWQVLQIYTSFMLEIQSDVVGNVGTLKSPHSGLPTTKKPSPGRGRRSPHLRAPL